MPAVWPNIPLILITDARAVFHARGHIHVHHMFPHHAGFTLTLAAWIRNHAPRTLARWAWSRDAEDGLLITHLPAPAASCARGRRLAPRRSCAFTVFARLVAPDLDL